MRKLGRPKGSTYPDEPYLNKIADELTRDPRKTANSVIMEIIVEEGTTDCQSQEAFRRRLHHKWSAQKDNLMREARNDERNRPARQVEKQNMSILGVLRTVEASPVIQLQRMYDNLPHIRLQKSFDELSFVRIQKMVEEPAMRMQRLLANHNL